MNVQHEQLKNLMVRDKLFLKELYEGNDVEQKKRILNSASDSKVESKLNTESQLARSINMTNERFKLEIINVLVGLLSWSCNMHCFLAFEYVLILFS